MIEILFDGLCNLALYKNVQISHPHCWQSKLKMVSVKRRLQAGVKCGLRVQYRLHADYSYDTHIQSVVSFFCLFILFLFLFLFLFFCSIIEG